MICDRDHVVAVAGLPKKEMVERRLSVEMENILENRKMVVLSDEEAPHPASRPAAMVQAMPRERSFLAFMVLSSLQISLGRGSVAPRRSALSVGNVSNLFLSIS